MALRTVIVTITLVFAIILSTNHVFSQKISRSGWEVYSKNIKYSGGWGLQDRSEVRASVLSGVGEENKARLILACGYRGSVDLVLEATSVRKVGWYEGGVVLISNAIKAVAFTIDGSGDDVLSRGLNEKFTKENPYVVISGIDRHPWTINFLKNSEEIELTLMHSVRNIDYMRTRSKNENEKYSYYKDRPEYFMPTVSGGSALLFKMTGFESAIDVVAASCRS